MIHLCARLRWVSAAALTCLALSACDPGVSEKAAPSPTPTPSWVKPPLDYTPPEWETDRKLNPDEKAAAGEAYDVLKKYWKAESSVTSDSGHDVERVLQYMSGDLTDELKESFEYRREAGIEEVGEVIVRYAKVAKAAPDEVEFHVCSEIDNWDIFDRDGKSLKNFEYEPKEGEITVAQTGEGWKVDYVYYPDRKCR